MTIDIKIQPSATQGFYVLIGSEPLGYYSSSVAIARDVADYMRACQLEAQPIKCFNVIVKDMVTCLLKKDLAKSKK